jgi:hypothetical protein
MRRAAKRDANQPEIVAALRKIGVFVVDLASAGDGIPDLLCGWHGSWKLVEVKDGSKPPCERQLTPDQIKFHAVCAERGLPCFVVNSVDEALSLFRGES